MLITKDILTNVDRNDLKYLSIKMSGEKQFILISSLKLSLFICIRNLKS